MLTRKPLSCVDYDPANQNLPITAATGKLFNDEATPTIAALKAAIAGSGVSARYPAAMMFGATRNDLIYVCRVHAITVAGLN